MKSTMIVLLILVFSIAAKSQDGLTSFVEIKGEVLRYSIPNSTQIVSCADEFKGQAKILLKTRDAYGKKIRILCVTNNEAFHPVISRLGIEALKNKVRPLVLVKGELLNPTKNMIITISISEIYTLPKSLYIKE